MVAETVTSQHCSAELLEQYYINKNNYSSFMHDKSSIVEAFIFLLCFC